MQRFTISKFSVVSPIISDDGLFPTKEAVNALRDIRLECDQQFVEVHFLSDDKVRIIGRNNRLMKVPKKCLNSLDVLTNWIHERIEKA